MSYASSGLSAGVITGAQLDAFVLLAAAGSPTEPTLSITAPLLRKLRRRMTDPGLLLILRRILGKATEVQLRTAH